MPGQKIELLLPPGIYGVRVFNPSGDGSTANLWYGRDQSWFYDLHIAKEAPTRTIDLLWKWPGVAILNDDLTRDMTFLTVTDRSLTNKFITTGFGKNRNLHDFIYGANGGDFGQYQVVDHLWYFYWESQPQMHPAPDNPTHTLLQHYYTDWHEQNTGTTSWMWPRRMDSNGFLHWFDSTIDTTLAGFPDGNHGPVAKQHGYYTLILTLEAKTLASNGFSYTFRGITPSNDPPVDPQNPSNQGTGFAFLDALYTGVHGPGYNNPFPDSNYRIRRYGVGSIYIGQWTDTDGGIANTGELRPGQDGYQEGKSRIRVRIRFKRVP
jgi:hypothetical protein